MKRVVIIGSAIAGGAGQIIEAMKAEGSQKPVFILDRDFEKIKEGVFGVPVLGKADEVIERWGRDEFDEAIIAIGGDLNERKNVFDFLTKNNIPLANIIDPSVRLGLNVTLGYGNVILNNTYLGNNVSIGNNNYVLNQCSFQHDTGINDHNYFATNTTVGAKVKLGSLNRLSIKCVVETKACIGDGYRFETGTIITQDNKNFL